MKINMLQIAIFNIGAGQCIFFYPNGSKEYAMFVDCAESEDFKPINWLLEKGHIHHDGAQHVLSNLTLTNYDHDHFSGLPEILKKVHIGTVRLPKNLTAEEIKACKEETTEALEGICALRSNYIYDAPQHVPPYEVNAFHLHQAHFPDQEINTNHLSQMVFVGYGGSQICISGDLERPAWELILQQPGVVENLRKTNVFVAAHHGRDNGYHETIFSHCAPECVIISDKEMMHETQDAMAQTYSNHVTGDGVNFNGTSRKVLTTRSDGHILINFHPDGNREYTTLLTD